MDFTLCDRARFFPGRSVGGFSDGPLVDTGYEMPIGGRVYLHPREIRDAGRLFGMHTDDEHQAVQIALEAAEEQLAALEAELEPLRVIGEALEARLGLHRVHSGSEAEVVKAAKKLRVTDKLEKAAV